ncbi:MAG: hypothetical protein HXM85_07775 [Neisseria sp.]|nr:hypothetical protein [Neisseria sp.]
MKEGWQRSSETVAWALPTNQTQNFRRPLLAVIIVGEAHATMHTDEAKGRLKTGGAILPKPPPSFPRRRESRSLRSRQP